MKSYIHLFLFPEFSLYQRPTWRWFFRLVGTVHHQLEVNSSVLLTFSQVADGRSWPLKEVSSLSYPTSSSDCNYRQVLGLRRLSASSRSPAIDGSSPRCIEGDSGAEAIPDHSAQGDPSLGEGVSSRKPGEGSDLGAGFGLMLGDHGENKIM